MNRLITFTRAQEKADRWLSRERDERKGGSVEGSRLSGEEAKHFYETLLQTAEEKAAGPSSCSATQRKARPGKRKRREEPRQHSSTANRVHPAGGQAAERNGHQMLKCAQNGDLKCLSGLVEKQGCDVNFRDSYYWTAMMCAAYAGHCQVVQYLLQQGAAWVGVVETQGRDAMDLAEEAGHTEVVRALQDFRAISEEQTANRRRSATVKRWCAVCQMEYSEDSVEQHERSTVHLFSQGSTPAPTYYCLPENNVGFRLMVREGWDPESGLGPAGKGRKFPVKTVLKRDQKGLGFQTDLKAKVTHFSARDTQAVERAPGGKAGRTERVATVSKKEERRREEREKDWERDLRTYMNL